MKINAYTKAAKSYNEDAIINQHPLYIVIDGATPLYNRDIFENGSIASKLVDYVVNNMERVYHENHNFEKTIFKLSIDAFNHFQFDTDEPAKLPSLGLAAVVDQGEFLKLYLLGDCSISIQRKNSTLERYVDNRVSVLDKKVIAELKKGKSRENILPLLIKHRNLLGIDYQAFIPSENPHFVFNTKRIRKSDVSKILIYSDGYYSARDTFKIVKNHQEFFEYPTLEMIDKIYEVAYKDYDLKKYPRFKLVDDISVIEIVFDN